MKESFVLYTVQYKAVAELKPEQKGLLFDSLFQYVMSGKEPPINDDAVRIAFNFMRVQIDIDGAKYAEVCAKRREAINKRWQHNEQKNTKVNKSKQKNTKVSKPLQNFTSVTDNDNGNVDVNDNDNVNVNEETKVSLIEEKKEKKESRSEEIEKFFVRCLEYFNSMVAYHGSSMKKVKAITPERRERLTQIFQTYKQADYQAAILHAVQSKFCNGRTRDRNRPVDFNWLIQFENFTKAFENAL